MILKCLGIAMLGICISRVLKSILPSLSPFVICGCGIIITGLCLSQSEGSIGYYYSVCTNSGYSDYFGVMLKGLGVSFIANIGTELCRDCGEGQLAGYLEFCAKTEILVLAFPLVKNLIEMSETIILK